MTRKVDLPSIEQIERAKASMLADAHETGRRATVTALAKLLNLSNPTFWRYFPDTARDIAAHGRAERTEPKATNKIQRLEEQLAALKRASRDADAHLQIAVAHIQRLTNLSATQVSENCCSHWTRRTKATLAFGNAKHRRFAPARRHGVRLTRPTNSLSLQVIR